MEKLQNEPNFGPSTLLGDAKGNCFKCALVIAAGLHEMQ
jgi:hypothetical protein